MFRVSIDSLSCSTGPSLFSFRKCRPPPLRSIYMQPPLRHEKSCRILKQVLKPYDNRDLNSAVSAW